MARSRTKLLPVLAIILSVSCTHKSRFYDPTGSKYPQDIAHIMLNKCAVSGCHNDLSYINAGNLNLTTWDKLFEGGEAGAIAIPYRPDFSPLCYFTNTYNDLGIKLQPTMPYDNTPLSRNEYMRLRDWIASGAPSIRAEVKFVDDPLRKKFYITNRLCNVVTVIDAASLLQMRYIDVGGSTAKYPCTVKVSPDKRHWYVSFYTQTSIIQKFDATDDKPAGQLNLGPGAWTSFAISADSKHAWFADNSSEGKVAYANLESMTLIATYTFGGNFRYPIGIALNEQYHKLYVGATSGNYVYRIDITDPLQPVITELPVDGKGIVYHEPMLDPIELLADPQSGKCYIACARSGEIRVFDMEHDILLNTVVPGTNPACMALSPASQRLLVSCPDDSSSFTGNRGSVMVLDITTNTILKKIKTGYQPYGIAIDYERGIAAVVNANISSAGPASHHASGCGSKNGNVTFIDLNTQEMIPGKQLEVAVFPYGAAAR